LICSSLALAASGIAWPGGARSSGGGDPDLVAGMARSPGTAFWNEPAARWSPFAGGSGGSTEPVMLVWRAGLAGSNGPRGASICAGRGMDAAPRRLSGSGPGKLPGGRSGRAPVGGPDRTPGGRPGGAPVGGPGWIPGGELGWAAGIGSGSSPGCAPGRMTGNGLVGSESSSLTSDGSWAGRSGRYSTWTGGAKPVGGRNGLSPAPDANGRWIRSFGGSGAR
jgi:hypothetical protein